MVTPARPLASGRDCNIYALGDGRVARTYGDGRPAAREAELISAVHALGYPVPRVDEWDGPTIVMERIDGPTLGAEMLGDGMPLDEGAAIWAELQERLHRLPWPGDEPLLHLDFHPFNVILGADGPVVIDWTNAGPGPAGLDVAMSALILAGVALTGEVPEADQLLDAYAAAVVTPYVDHLPRAAEIRASKPLTTPEELRVMEQAVALAGSVARPA
jgi:tRNA A-37 threonylcarbamoyl transferase component Bud32